MTWADGTRYGATAILQPAPVLKHVYTVEDAYSSSELAKAAVRRLAVQHQAIESLKQVFDSLPTGLKSGVNGTMASATASSSAAQLPPTAPKVPRGSPPAEGSSTSNAQTDIANPIGTLHEAAQKHPSIPLPIYDFTDTGQVLICSLTIPLAGQPLVFREEVVYNTNKPSTKRMKEAVSRSAIHKGVLDILNNDSRQKTSLLLTQRIQTPAAPYVPVASSSALPRPPLTPTASASSHLFDNIPNPVGKIMEALQAAGKSTNMIAFVSTQDTVFGGTLSFLLTSTNADVQPVPMFGCKIDVDGSTRYIQEATCKSKKEAKDFAARRALNEGVLELIRARPRTASERLGKISMPAQQAWLTAPKDPDDALGVKGPLQSRATPKVVESAAQRASVIGNGSAVADAPPASETMKRLERICVDKLGENKITYEIRTDPRCECFFDSSECS